MLMGIIKRSVEPNYKKVQILFERMKYISKILFFPFYLHGINQSACHKYVKDSPGSVSSWAAGWLQTMADGSWTWRQGD